MAQQLIFWVRLRVWIDVASETLQRPMKHVKGPAVQVYIPFEMLQKWLKHSKIVPLQMKHYFGTFHFCLSLIWNSTWETSWVYPLPTTIPARPLGLEQGPPAPIPSTWKGKERSGGSGRPYHPSTLACLLSALSSLLPPTPVTGREGGSWEQSPGLLQPWLWLEKASVFWNIPDRNSTGHEHSPMTETLLS